MSSIYVQHDKSFSSVAAFVIAKDGKRVATIAIKFPKDGAGRLYAYVHWIGEEMVCGSASGYGYDKRSAAVADAARELETKYHQPGVRDHNQIPFMNELRKDDGYDWNHRLQAVGFDVWQAV